MRLKSEKTATSHFYCGLTNFFNNFQIFIIMNGLILPSWYNQANTDCIDNPYFVFTFTLSEERGKFNTATLEYVRPSNDFIHSDIMEWAKNKNCFYVFSNGLDVETCFSLKLDADKEFQPDNSENVFMHSPESLIETNDLVEAICGLFRDREERIARYRQIKYNQKNPPKNYLKK